MVNSREYAVPTSFDMDVHSAQQSPPAHQRSLNRHSTTQTRLGLSQQSVTSTKSSRKKFCTGQAVPRQSHCYDYQMESWYEEFCAKHKEASHRENEARWVFGKLDRHNKGIINLEDFIVGMRTKLRCEWNDRCLTSFFGDIQRDSECLLSSVASDEIDPKTPHNDHISLNAFMCLMLTERQHWTWRRLSEIAIESALKAKRKRADDEPTNRMRPPNSQTHSRSSSAIGAIGPPQTRDSSDVMQVMSASGSKRTRTFYRKRALSHIDDALSDVSPTSSEAESDEKFDSLSENQINLLLEHVLMHDHSAVQSPPQRPANFSYRNQPWYPNYLSKMRYTKYPSALQREADASRVFCILDPDGVGIIDCEHFLKGMRTMRSEWSDREIRHLFNWIESHARKHMLLETTQRGQLPLNTFMRVMLTEEYHITWQLVSSTIYHAIEELPLVTENVDRNVRSDMISHPTKSTHNRRLLKRARRLFKKIDSDRTGTITLPYVIFGAGNNGEISFYLFVRHLLLYGCGLLDSIEAHEEYSITWHRSTRESNRERTTQHRHHSDHTVTKYNDLQTMSTTPRYGGKHVASAKSRGSSRGRERGASSNMHSTAPRRSAYSTSQAFPNRARSNHRRTSSHKMPGQRHTPDAEQRTRMRADTRANARYRLMNVARQKCSRSVAERFVNHMMATNDAKDILDMTLPAKREALLKQIDQYKNKFEFPSL